MNKRTDDFWKDNWKPIVVFIYLALILSFGIISYFVYTSPAEEEVGKYEISIIITNKKNSSETVTVKMESETVMAEDINSFKDKTIRPGEVVEFEADTDASYTNIPYTMIVYRPGNPSEPLVRKEVNLYTGGTYGDETFYVDIS